MKNFVFRITRTVALTEAPLPVLVAVARTLTSATDASTRTIVRKIKTAAITVSQHISKNICVTLIDFLSPIKRISQFLIKEKLFLELRLGLANWLVR